LIGQDGEIGRRDEVPEAGDGFFEKSLFGKKAKKMFRGFASAQGPKAFTGTTGEYIDVERIHYALWNIAEDGGKTKQKARQEWVLFWLRPFSERVKGVVGSFTFCLEDDAEKSSEVSLRPALVLEPAQIFCGYFEERASFETTERHPPCAKFFPIIGCVLCP
jgi:hypothetical protein